jgi:hypothetical protein
MTYKSGMKIKVNVKRRAGTGIDFFKEMYQDILEDNISGGMNAEEANDDAIEGALDAILDMELSHSKADDLLGDDGHMNGGDLFATDVVFLDNEEAEFTIKSWND